MTFITPALAIAGLIAAAIPIIIHLLFRQRKRPIEWAAMRFLIEAFKKHKRRLQLEQWILLAIRCLILLLLGAALARPLLEKAGLVDLGGARAVYLVIDNGMISGLTDADDQTAMEHHIGRARTIVESLGAGDAVGVVAAARPARALVHPPSTDHASVLKLLDELESSQTPTDLNAAFGELRTALRDATTDYDQTLVYLLSEFRAGSADLDTALTGGFDDIDEDITLLHAPPAAQTVSNVQVVSIEPLRSILLPDLADGSGRITVKLARTGGDAQVTRVRLEAENLPLTEPQVVEWTPGMTEAEATFTIDPETTGTQYVAMRAAIEDDALNADNARQMVLESRQRVRIALLDRRSFGYEPTVDNLRTGQWITRALEPGAGAVMEVVEVEPAAFDPADLRVTDVVIAPRPDLIADTGWVQLRRFVDRGGLLIVLPPEELNVHQWVARLNDALDLPVQMEMEPVDHPEGLALAAEQPASELLRLIAADLNSLVRATIMVKTIPFDVDVTRGERILELADGTPLIVAASPQPKPEENGAAGTSPAPPSQGFVVVFGSAMNLNWTTLPATPLMVPLFQELVRQGLSRIRASERITVGERPNLAAAGSIRGPEGNRTTLQDGRPVTAIATAGMYEVLDPAGQPIRSVAVNVNADAGRPDVRSPAEISTWLATSGDWKSFEVDDPAGALRSTASGSPLAGALLWMLLGLVLLETLLARWFSHAKIGDADPSSFATRAAGRPAGARGATA